MSIEYSRIQGIAVTMFAAALADRCGAMIVRLTNPHTRADEIAEFREEALNYVQQLPAALSLSAAEAVEAMRLASEHLNEVCDGWLGKDQAPIAGRPSLN